MSQFWINYCANIQKMDCAFSNIYYEDWNFMQQMCHMEERARETFPNTWTNEQLNDALTLSTL